MQPAHVANLLRQNETMREFVECVRDSHDCNNYDGPFEGDQRPYPHDEVTDCWRCYAESVLAEVTKGKRKKFRAARRAA